MYFSFNMYSSLSLSISHYYAMAFTFAFPLAVMYFIYYGHTQSRSCCWGAYCCLPLYGLAIFHYSSVSRFGHAFFSHCPCSYLVLESVCAEVSVGAWVLWEEGFLSYIQARNCLVIWKLGFRCLKDALECSACGSVRFSISPTASETSHLPRPSGEFIVPGCLHDKHSDLVGNDTLGARFNHFSSVVIYVDIHFLCDFKCFPVFFSVYLVWVILTCWDWLLESRSVLFIFPPSAPSSWLFLVDPGSFPAPSGLVRDSVPRSSGVTCSWYNVSTRQRTFPHLTDCWEKLRPQWIRLPGLSLGNVLAQKNPWGLLSS